MGAVAWRAVYASAAAGAMSPSLDGGAVGNQSDVWPSAVRFGRYSVASGKKVQVETLAFTAARPGNSVAAIPATAVNTGVAMFRVAATARLEVRVLGATLPAGAGWEDQPQFWRSANNLPPVMGNGITVAAGTALDVVVTPAALTATKWRAAFWGSEGGSKVLVSGSLTSYTTAANQTVLSYTPAATFTLLGFRVEGNRVGPVMGNARLALDGVTCMDLGRQGFEQGATQPGGGGFGLGAILLPLWGMTLYPGQSFEGLCLPWESDGSEWQVALFGKDADLAGGTFPAVGDVQTGVVYGPTDNLTGTLALPAVGDVDLGVGYGASGTEFTGTLKQPAEADVRSGTQYGAGGTEFTGSLVAGGGGAGTVYLRRGR